MLKEAREEASRLCFVVRLEMECNKEEALRAKEIAESKLHLKDFAGARKMALRAQKLYPDLDNILQILAVCDVHCAAENKFAGIEMDWYGILQVEQTAGEQLVKKQFKRLALLLHPDKNNCVGAEGAFKLIKEAQQVLLDSAKRSMHDMKRRVFFRPTPTPPVPVPRRTPQPPESRPSNIMKQPTVRANTSTSSPYVNPPSVVQPEAPKSSPAIPEKKEIPNGRTCKESGFQNTNYSKPINGNCNGEHSMKVDQETGSCKNKPTMAKGKRVRKQVVESCESFNSVSSSDTDSEDTHEEDYDIKLKNRSGFNQDETRRSVRKRQKVQNYAKGSFVDDHLVSGSSSKQTAEQKILECPDPEFSDFDRIRNRECFKRGQVWAIYDDKGAMPRFYALIKHVYVNDFKVRITWLEPDPDDGEGELIEWVNKELPFSCGQFSTGQTQTIDDLSTFSHIVEPQQINSTGAYRIYPRKGETWAIFKNWDLEWINNFDINWKFEFEFVEILSDYNDGDGIFVAYLDRVENFVSIFRRIVKEEVESFKIPYFELCRFSHRVPSFKMTGKEREDVPKGSFELDPASLPFNLEYEVKPVTGANGAPSKSQTNEPEVTFVTIEDDSSTSSEEENGDNDNQAALETPKPIFYDFDAERSEENFQVGQVWALYTDFDALPKWFAKISKIDSSPSMKLHINWLLPLLDPNSNMCWADEDMPIGCGRFKLKAGRASHNSNVRAFSHRINAKEVRKIRSEFSIYPEAGEIWALYTNWNIGMKASELQDCDYDIAEVIQVNHSSTRVVIFEKVNGYHSVFKRQVKEGSLVYEEILHVDQLIRFSHQIPAFQLTNERDGILNGCWELDPASVPPVLLVSD